MKPAIKLEQLPNATKARFALLLTICLASAFAFFQPISILSGEPGWSPQAKSLFNGAVGAIAVLLAGSLYYIFHPLFRSRSFGPASEIPGNEPIALRVKEISASLGVPVPRLLMDRNIRNYDALAFGGPGQKTILMGRGNLFLFATQPALFDARLAHEIGHIRNRDIAATFVAEGLIAVLIGTFLFSLVSWAWNVIHTLALYWGSPGLGDWLVSAATMAVGLVFFIVFWLAILMGEQRSFLRSRELYADNVAALTFGSNSISSALATSDPSEKDFGGRARELFSAHPELSFRRSAVDDPVIIYEPSPGRFAWMGYVVGLLHAVAWTIRDLPDINQLTTEGFLRLLLTTANGFLFFLFLGLLFGAAIIAVGSLVLRTSCWIRLVRPSLPCQNTQTCTINHRPNHRPIPRPLSEPVLTHASFARGRCRFIRYWHWHGRSLCRRADGRCNHRQHPDRRTAADITEEARTRRDYVDCHWLCPLHYNLLLQYGIPGRF